MSHFLRAHTIYVYMYVYTKVYVYLRTQHVGIGEKYVHVIGAKPQSTMPLGRVERINKYYTTTICILIPLKIYFVNI